MNDLPKMMSAVLLMGHGDLEQLHYRQYIRTPRPKTHEVLIRVHAAALNNTDINTRTAWYSKNNDAKDATWNGNAMSFPRIQGADVCGEIVAVGDEIDSSRIGERVLVEPCIRDDNGERLERCHYLGSECDGGFAEYCVVSAKQAYKIESTLSSIELASFPCSYSTAENMLSRAFVGKDERVLITGASGGVGSAAIQLAKVRGAQVIAISREAKREKLLDIGADEVLDREQDLIEILGENSVDVVIDLVAGSQWSQLLAVLKPKGRYAVSGAIGGAMVELDVRTLYLKDLTMFGCTELEPESFINLIRHIELGNLKSLVAKTYPLAEIKAAQELFTKKKHIGKIVLKCAEL